MKKQKKMEITILLLLLIILVVVSSFTYQIISTYKVKDSESKKTESYVKNKSYDFSKNFGDFPNINILYIENIDGFSSRVNCNIKSQDNIIQNYSEHLELHYFISEEEMRNNLVNFCNSYNVVKNVYSKLCTFSNDIMVIDNDYNIKILDQTKDDLKIDISKDTRLSDYINYLETKKERN